MLTLVIPHTRATETTIVYINPKESSIPYGERFNITVNVQNVANLNFWQINITFNPKMLNCPSFQVPTDNIFQGYPLTIPPGLPKINNTVGSIFAVCYIDASLGVNGSGTLCQIEFQTYIPGITSLDIKNEDTFLITQDFKLIPFTAMDGTIEITGLGFSKNSFKVIQNGTEYSILVFSNSTISNFNYSYALQQITYDATGLSQTTGSSVVISKELLGCTLAVLINNVATDYIKSENSTHIFVHFVYSHTTASIKIWTTIVCDLNGDRKVDMIDLWLIAKAFGSFPQSPNWNPLADINFDGKVDMIDAWEVARKFGKVWNYP
jgi:hypothetical protein